MIFFVTDDPPEPYSSGPLFFIFADELSGDRICERRRKVLWHHFFSTFPARYLGNIAGCVPGMLLPRHTLPYCWNS
jgi:hypothetical protein